MQLRFNYGGKRHYLSTGYPDTPQHRKLAEIKAKEIEKDILYERFDPSNLDKYRPQAALSTVTPVTPIAPPQPSLAELWEKYTEFKRPSLSPSTLAKDYVKIARCISAHLPTQALCDAVAIRDWLVANKTPNAAKRVLTQFSACCDWAMKSQLISDNPFDGMAADIHVPKGESEEADINPFSLEERDPERISFAARIIAAFQQDRYYKFYAPLIEFLFLTGCRPSEAVASQTKGAPCNGSTFLPIAALSASSRPCDLREWLGVQKRTQDPEEAYLSSKCSTGSTAQVY
ncbi:DUF3596 domain-containing protein [Microcoleus sp. FACHB-1515]|uniref:Arm DNA-binding domain-containing protein n=1 Tax=Leptolyngbya sp. FACHB-1515 TaxID=2933931 RepID=UPI0018F031AD|nr:DUF3596 domain-containing protein [Microcoleus sp. FACHB-1515]